MTHQPSLRGGGLFLSLFGALLLLGAFSAPLFAADHGQIAVIADTNGKILPATTLGCGMKYPNTLCVPQAGLAFYASHPDNYDILIVFTTKAISAIEKTGYPLVADAKGIGQDTTPWSYKDFGSKGRLIQGVTLGSLPSMPDDPEGIFTGGIPVSGLEIAGHEIGHHWLAYANVNHGDGSGNLDIIRGHRSEGETQTTITHWSCWFNSNSVMYGGMLTDNGDGTFTDVNGPRKYSQLDQYLMGLRRPDEVDPMFYVKVNYGIYGCADWPQARGVAHTIEGERVDFPIGDVIRALGARQPATSPCHYKVAFALVHPPNNPPTEADLAKVERYRAQLEPWYASATDGRGSLDTRLDGCGTGTASCPGKPSLQCGAAADGDDDGEEEADSDGARVCPPGVKRCTGDTLEECASDGLAWQTVENCGAGLCQGDACLEAEREADGDSAEREAAAEADSDLTEQDSEKDAAFENEDSVSEQDRDTLTPPEEKSGSGSGCQGNSGAFKGWLLLFALAFGLVRRSSRAF